MTDQADFEAATKARLQKIADASLAHVEHVLKSGTFAAKNIVIRQVFPVIMKALSPEEANLELETLKQELDAMRSEILGTSPRDEPVPDS